MLTRKFARLFVLAILGTMVTASSAFAQYSQIALPLNYSWATRYIPQPKAFDYFQGNDNGTSIRNRYLLAHLSMKVYNTSGVSDSAFEEHLQVFYGNHGVNDVQLFTDASTGADGAIFVTDDAVIVAFRGTSTDSDGNRADLYTDLDNRVKLVKVNNREVGIHQGFWTAANSVYPEILQRVVTEVDQHNKKVWLTGHSLGGAMAMVTAFRLQYQSGIPVQGLVSYGAPRVGNDWFYKEVERSAAGTSSLIQSTQRFVLDGDPAPTYWNNGWDYRKRKHAYHHFGTTHTIFDEGSEYDFHYNSGELQMAWIPPHQIYGRLSTGIHMDYEIALYWETADLLLDAGDDHILSAFNDLPLY